MNKKWFYVLLWLKLLKQSLETVLIENLLDNKIMFEVQAPAFQKGHMFSKH